MPFLLALVLTACSYDPPVDTALAQPASTTLEGQLVMTDGLHPMGPGLIFLFDAADPPPPLGFGQPQGISTVPPNAWSTASGVTTAPWSLSGVQDGTWIIMALIDENADLNPFHDFTAGAGCGDRSGAFVASATSTSPKAVTVEGPAVVEGLGVLIGTPLSTERPVFQLPEVQKILTQPKDMDAYYPAMADFHLELASTGVTHPLLRIPAPGEVAACPTAFIVTVVDSDADGVPDPHQNADYAALGLHDLWPRIYFVYAQDLEGNPPAEGEAWLAQGIMDEATLLPGHSAGETFASTALPLFFVPAAMHMLPDGTAEMLQAPDLPSGIWAIMVVEPTGQYWLTPNELADEAVSAAFGVSPDPGQASVIVLQ